MMMSDKAQPVQLRKMRFALIRAKAHLPAALPPILALIDPVRTPEPLVLAEALPRGTGLIFRHFGVENKLEIGLCLAQIAARRRLTLLIGNDPQLAMKVKASGVHWSEAAMFSARRWKGRFPIMTGAAHSRAASFKAGLRVPVLAAQLGQGLFVKMPSMPTYRFMRLVALKLKTRKK